MAWNSIVVDDFIKGSVLTRDEITQYNTQQLPSGQSNAFTVLLNNTIADVRSRIGSCPLNKLGPDGYIPDEVRDDVFRIVAWRCIMRLPLTTQNADALTTERKWSERNAWQHINMIARGDIRIVPATTFSASQVAQPGVTLARTNRDSATPDQQDGLITGSPNRRSNEDFPHQ